MKDRIISLLTRNILLKIISLGVAFILWLVVVNYDDPTITRTYSGIPVELVNTTFITDKGQVFDLKDDSKTVAVNVKAKRSIHNNLSRDDFRATADLSKVDGAGEAPVDVKSLRSADRIDSITLRGHSTVTLEIEKLMEKQINIQVRTEGNLSEEYKVGNISLDKNVVKVSGPESQVDQVVRAMVTVDIDGMTQDISTSEDVELFDKDGGQIKSDDLLMSRTSVGVTVQLWKIKAIPVSYGYLGEPADGYGLTGVIKCEPETVQVAGVASAIDSATSLVIPAASADITGATEDKTFTFSAKDYLPASLSLADDEYDGNINITVGVSALGSKVIEVPVANVAVLNVPEGMVATVGGLGDMMALRVMGLGPAFDELNPLLVIGVIDVAALGIADEEGNIVPGAYDAQISFTYPDGVIDGGNTVMSQLIIRSEEAVSHVVPAEE